MGDFISSIQQSAAFAKGGYGFIIVDGLLIVIATVIVAHIAERFAKRLYSSVHDEGQTSTLFNYGIRIVVYGIGIYALFKVCFDIDLTVVLGALGVGGLALSLGMQDTVKNVLAGVQITFSHEISIGDWIVVGGVDGEVVDVHLRNTTLIDDCGQSHIIPNSVLYSSTFTRKPDYFLVPINIVLSREFDIKEHGPVICKIVDDAFAANGMQHNVKRTALREVGITAEGIQCTLMVYSTWSFGTSQVKTAAVEPVVKYLQERSLLAKLI